MTKIFAQQFISAKSVISIISWLFFVMSIATVSSLYYFLSSLDGFAVNELNQRVTLAMNLESEHRRDILEEYSYWDEAYQKIILDHNEDWINDNSGHFILTNNSLDFSISVENKKHIVNLTFGDDTKPASSDDIMKQGLAKLMNESKGLDSVTKTVSGYLRLGELVYFVVGGPFIDEETAEPHEGSFLAFGKRMDDEYIAHLAFNYQLSGLTLASPTTNTEHHTPLMSPLNQHVASLAWKPSLPSKEILPYLTLIIMLFSLFTILVTRHILHKDQTNRDEYEDQLFNEATRDSLTQIHNRKYFMDVGIQKFQSYKLRHRSFALIIIDVDRFKAINDVYGHICGDQALQLFTRCCNEELRPDDTFGRIGGEEFAILLPDTSLDTAYEIANGIRLSVMNSPVHSKKHHIHFTVSLGLSILNHQDSFEELLDQADKALYQAKRNGRNMVSVYQPM